MNWNLEYDRVFRQNGTLADTGALFLACVMCLFFCILVILILFGSVSKEEVSLSTRFPTTADFSTLWRRCTVARDGEPRRRTGRV